MELYETHEHHYKTNPLTDDDALNLTGDVATISRKRKKEPCIISILKRIESGHCFL